MPKAYVVGQIMVKDAQLWALYQSEVPSTLVPWQGKLVFRGVKAAQLAGECRHPHTVVICFPSLAAAESWFSSDDYQALIPTRTRAADVNLMIYES